MGELKPKRRQVQDSCGICSIEFSLMNKRHHCRGMAISPAPLVPHHLLANEVRRHTLVSRDERDDGCRIRSPPDALRRAAHEARRDRNDDSNRMWNRDDEPIRVMRRDEEPRTMQSARGHRLRSPGAHSPLGRDPREVVYSRGRRIRDGDLHFRDLSNDTADPRRKRDPRARDLRERDPRARDPRARDPRERDPRARDPRARDPRERDPRERDLTNTRGPRERDLRARDLRARDPRERDPRERGLREKDSRERDRRIRDPRERDLRGNDPREKDSRERERRKRDLREQDPREKERRNRNPRVKDPRERERPRDRTLHERDLFDAAPREKSSRDSLKQKERRRRVLNSEPVRRQTNKMLGSFSGSENGNQRSETSSACRTASSTLSSFYAAVNATEDSKAKALSPKSKSKRLLPRKEKEIGSAFADSTFSIFSLKGSDHSDSESEPQKNGVQKLPARRPGKSRSNRAKRELMETKEHFDFSASSSSVKCFEVSAITQKYLIPKLAKAAMQKATPNPMNEEENESEDSNAEPSRRNADSRGHTSERRRNVRSSSQDKHHSKSRGKEQSKDQMLLPFQCGKPVDMSFRDSGELVQEQEKPSEQNTDVKPKHTTFALPMTRPWQTEESRDLAVKLRAKKAAIAGIDPASLDAKGNVPTTASYKLTRRDQEIMQQISELEAVVLQHNNDLLDLLDMYSEAIKRAQNAQKGLKKAKVRVARYEKAHAAVSRAIRSGKLYMKQKEYMAAILEISRAIGIERSNATLWYMLAECRLMVNQPAAAEDACMTCLKLHPTGAAVALLGRIMHGRGRTDEAIECYLEALGRNDESESEEDSEYSPPPSESP
ncbi:unnamed protein product [Peronospora destructor]|uniref:Uncharacterized protein n=1 Tax=Peronospora destructor TaxID=86335 RepID=A0AAV0T975_9STRA|nr:unnamed protein product [Peronospora destructor]